jgi:hypothetical protein
MPDTVSVTGSHLRQHDDTDQGAPVVIVTDDAAES